MAEASGSLKDGGQGGGARSGRQSLLCFATDADTEAALRQGLAEVMEPGTEFRRADIDGAIAALRGMATPVTLIVDITGHAQPFAALEDLSQVVEPDVRVLVVGDRQDLGFYRHVTRGIGVADYLYKPLTAAMVAEHFAGAIGNRRTAEPAPRGGRMVAVTGARGGVGASSIAANLAWHMANEARRNCVALDADLHRGTLALMLGGEAGSGLRTALETPARVDELFIDRAAHVVGDRLHVLAGEEALTNSLTYVPGAAERLLQVLRRRYNFVIADVPCQANDFARSLLDLAQQRVIVMQPTLAGIRDALRLMQLPAGSGQVHRPLLVVNRAGMPGGLATAKVTDAMKQEADIVLPDLPRKVEEAATLGQPAAARGYQSAIAKLAAICGATQGNAAAAPAKRGLMGLFRK